MSNFFIYEALIIEQQLDITGFELYSPGHLIWLAAIVIVSIIASIRYRRSSGRERDRTRRFFALAILIAETVSYTHLDVYKRQAHGGHMSTVE